MLVKMCGVFKELILTHIRTTVNVFAAVWSFIASHFNVIYILEMKEMMTMIMIMMMMNFETTIVIG